MANDDIDLIDPVFDTGKWRKEIYRLLRENREAADAAEEARKAHAAAMEKLGITIQLDAANSAKLIAELKAAWEAEHRVKYSLTKAFRDALSKLVGDIDTHVLKK